MSIRVSLEGLNEVKRSFNIVNRKVKDDLNKAIIKSTIAVESKAKQNAPVDTGRLRSSIYSKTSNNEGVITSANVNYAPYMEFGTGDFVDFSYIDDPKIRQEAKLAASQFKGKGKRNVNIKGYGYLLTAFLDVKNTFLRSMKRIIK